MREKIERYKDIDARFHMPGHSGVDLDGGLYSVAKYDITELDFSDNLQCPTADIQALETRLAKVYGAKRSLLITSGATTGIDTALLVAREMRGELYLLGETHKSCVSYASIIGLTLVHLDSVDDAVKRASEGKWIYVTTPNYYGECIDISRILEARRDGSAVIVDEAHGAHFVFSSLLPRSNSSRADFVIESLHKTLPVFTGGAVLNVNNDEYIAISEYFKNKIHTTSPSYLIMQSVDYAVERMTREGERMYSDIRSRIDDFRLRLADRYSVMDNDDFSRLVIYTKDGEKTAKYLETKGIYIELNDSHRLVLIVTPFNVDKLDRVLDALNSFDGGEVSKGDDNVDIRLERAKGVIGRVQFVPLRDAVGKVSMSEIAVYPPGVPVVRTGDILNIEAIDYIESNRDRIVGLIGDTIAVRDVCEEN